MRVGRYVVGTGSLGVLARLVLDARRVRRDGIPRAPGVGVEADAAEVARAVLRANAGAVLSAGLGHFKEAWAADFGVAFRGALHALPREYLARLLSRALRESARLGRVPTCFTPRGSFDSPWPRADGAPWLLHAADALREAGDEAFGAAHARELASVFSDWERATMDPGTRLVAHAVTGDWMDTVPRPSSTYNNLCALRAYQVAERLGLPRERSTFAATERALLGDRLRPHGLLDHAGAEPYASGDAGALALYFAFFPRSTREAIADALDQAGLDRPVPLRAREGAHARERLPVATRFAPDYHSTTWLHLGLFHAGGLARLGRDERPGLAAVERTVRRHGTFLETLDARGDPHVSRFVATEHGFTMSAGLYLEVAARRREPRERA